MTEKQKIKVTNDKILSDETQKLRGQFEESRKMEAVSNRISQFVERKDAGVNEGK